ncbi:hypothetical protein [Polaribacter sp. R77954]|uniref:hypothetical protein n=1 Tax=Polaribacter sp. R77954 TaxID=3093870 RepID=UPI0037C53761
MLKKIILFLLVSLNISIYGQNNNLSKYKYIVVASKFDFLKKVDQYQTSSLTKFLLKKKGFKVYLDSETLPKDIINKSCAVLTAKIIDESSMLTTKNRIEFFDCYGKVVYKSEIGKSKNKEYKKAYQEAIRNAFDTMEDFEYSYNPSSKDIATKQEVVTARVTSKTIVTPEEKVKKQDVDVPSLKVLYAQAIENGYQFVNTKPEVVFKVLKTNVKEVYIIDGKNGIFYKVGEKWIAEYYENNQLKHAEYTIKF